MVQVWKSVGKLSQQGVILGMPFCLSQFLPSQPFQWESTYFHVQAKFRPKGLSLFTENARNPAAPRFSCLSSPCLWQRYK